MGAENAPAPAAQAVEIGCGLVLNKSKVLNSSDNCHVQEKDKPAATFSNTETLQQLSHYTHMCHAVAGLLLPPPPNPYTSG